MKPAEKAMAAPTPKRKPLKTLAIVLAGIVVLLLLIVFTTPMFLSSSGGTRFLLGKINGSVDGRVGMDNFSVGWFSGVKLTNLTYESGDGATQVKVGRFETQPRYAALLGGRVDMGKTVIDQPQIYLKLSSAPDSGQTAPAASPKPSSPKDGSESAFVLPVQLIDLEILDGNATVEMLDANLQTQRVTFKNIASKVEMNAPGTLSRMALSATVADGENAGSLKAEGSVTPPKKGWTLEDTDGDLQVNITKLDLASLRPLLAMAGQDVQIGGVLNADASVQIRKGNPESIVANAEVTNFSHGTGAQKMAFTEPLTLSAQIGTKGNIVTIDKLDVKAPFCTVNCSGGTEMLDYAVTADLAKTQAFAEQFTDMSGYGMGGQLAVSGKLNLAEGMIATDGKGSVKALLLSKDGKKAPPTDVSLDYDVVMDNTKKLLKVASVTLSMLPGTISARNISMPTDAVGIAPVTLTAQANVDMAKAWEYATILGGAPADITLAGTLDAAISVETKDDIMRVKTDKTRIGKLRVTKTGGEPFIQDEIQLSADVTLDMLNQSIGIQTLDMQGAKGETLIKVTKGSKIQQSSSKGIKKLNADIEAEYDLQTLSSMAAGFLPEGLKVQGKRKDRFTASSQWPEKEPDKMMANLSANGNLGFDKAQYQGLNFGPTTLQLNVKQGQAAIDMPDADVNGGKVRFAGDVNLAQKPMKLTLRNPTQVVENVKIDDIVSEALLQYLSPVFANSRNVSGIANLSCSELAIPLGGGTPKDINLAGNVSLTEVRLNSPLLGLFKTALRREGLDLFSIPSTAFTVKDGFVRYTNMPLTFGSRYTLNFRGAIGLDKSMDMVVDVPINDKTVVVPLPNTLGNLDVDFNKLLLGNLPTILEGIFKKDK